MISEVYDLKKARKKTRFATPEFVKRIAEDVMAGRLKRSSLIKVIKGYLNPVKQAKQPVEIIDEKSKSKAEIKGTDKCAAARALIDLLKRWIVDNGIPAPSAN